VRLSGAIIAALCVAVVLGGCSFSRKPVGSNVPKGVTGAIGVVIKDFSTDASTNNPAALCNTVLSTSLVQHFAKLGGCKKVVSNAIATIDDFTFSITRFSWNPRTAIAIVKSVDDGKHQLSTLHLVNQTHGGWRLNSLG
jgi:PBP1b-binding outer membrane lipoprotein LpoB